MSEQTSVPESSSGASSNLGGFILIGAVTAVVLALKFSSGGAGGAHQLVGTRLGQLSVRPLSDSAMPMSGEGLLGKVTLVNFWGTWCGPCQRELPHLIELHRRFREDADFQFVSVTIPQGAGTTDAVLTAQSAAHLDRLGAEFEFYADEGTMDHLAMISGQFGLGIPTTLIIDRNGVIAGMWTGFRSGDERAMAATISEALDAKSSGEDQPATASR